MSYTQLKSAPFKYIGSKTNVASFLAGRAPFGERTLIEPFGGTGIVGFQWLAYNTDGVFRLNDLNRYCIAFFRAIKCDHHRFIAKVLGIQKETQWNQAEAHRIYLHQIQADLCTNDFDRAVAWYIVSRLCFHGIIDRPPIKNQYKDLTRSQIIDLHRYAVLMKRAEISNIDGIEILENATSGFHFCDPPYPGHRSALYKEGIIDRHTTFDHERFVSAVRNANVKVMVTVSDHPLYRALADVCWIEALPVRYSAGTNGRPSPIVVTELLITNYRPEYQAKVISVPTNPRAW